MPTVRADELPRVLTVAQAARHGVSASTVRTRVSHGSWRRMGGGVVLTRPDPPTRYDWAVAGVLVAGPSAAVSGWEACRVAGLTRGDPASRLPVLVLTREHRSRRMGPVLVRRTDRPFRMSYTPWEADLPLTPVVHNARAITDVALALPGLDEVRDVVSTAVQRGRCDLDALVTELLAGPRQGSAHLRTALGEVSAGARSVAEARALTALRRSDLPPCEFNVPILDVHGRHLFTVDVLWRALRAALEIDSAEYHFRRGDWIRTLDRHAALTAAGLSVLHLPPSRVTPAGRWLVDVGRWLDVRALELGLAHRGVSAEPVRTPPVPLILSTLVAPGR